MSVPGPTPLLLVDGSSYLYRAFHALPPLTNSKGAPTGAVFGVGNMLRKLVGEYRPERVAVVFDAPGKTFRDELFAAYKANRPAMQDDLARQIEPLHRLVRALGLPLLMVPNVEADDVIGTLARLAGERGMRTVISTGDKDMAQLVNGHVTLVNTMSDTVLDRAGVLEKFGVPPERIVDYLALIGDSSDNIPGVPKVGPKTAAKWLTAYESLDGILAHAQEIGGKVGESLRAHLDQLALSRQLATIHCELTLPVTLDALVPAAPDTAALHTLASELEVGSCLREVDRGGFVPAVSGAPAPVPVPPVQPAAADYETILTPERLAHWLDRLAAAPLFAFDTETTSLDYMVAEIVGVSFALEPGEAAYVPLAHRYMGAPAQLDRDTVLARLRPLLEAETPAKVGQNLKFDRNVLANHGITLRGIAHDTMLQSYVLNSMARQHDLDSLALRELGHQTVRFTDIAGKGAKQLTFDQIEIDIAAPYAAEDADIALRLHQRLWPRLQATPDLADVYRTLEMPLVPVLSRMEQTGVLVDCAMLARQGVELDSAIGELARQACAEAGCEFNLGSAKQLQEILFERLGLPARRKTPKGVPSTAEDVLQELAADYALPGLILEHRAMSKLKSTYVDRLPRQVCARTGRIHTSYHQAVAATGRLSSSDPNLQNIPIRTEAGRRIRQAFIAPPGQRLLAADYSQIELRIMAHLSGDAGLQQAFASGQDVHRATAAEVFGLAPGGVAPEQRRAAKAINFGLIYGMSAFGLARQLGIERGDAQRYIDRYFQRYPGVRAFMEQMREQAREAGYVSTVFGRRLYLPEIASRNAARRQYAERTAINAPMQGTAADIIKRAMIDIDDWLQRERVPARMLMQVHDELVFEVREDLAPELGEAVRARMQHAAELAVPLEVEVGIGANWDEAH